MKLKQEHFKKLAIKITTGLLQTKLAKPLKKEELITSTIVNILQADASKSESIKKQATKMMESYQAQVQSGQIDYQKMYGMILKELYKKEGLSSSSTNYSEDHISMLSLKIHDKLYHDEIVDYLDDEKTLSSIKKTMTAFFALRDKASEIAKNKIASLSKNIPQGSSEWHIMYEKYLAEELAKQGF